MSSITKRIKKLSAQREQYITPTTPYLQHMQAMRLNNPWTAAELRADKERDRNFVLENRAHVERLRKTRKPEYYDGGEWWVPRKTPDRSILRHQRLSKAV